MKIKHKLTMSVIQLETIFKIHRLQERKKKKAIGRSRKCSRHMQLFIYVAQTLW